MSGTNDMLAAGQGVVVTIAILNASSAVLTITEGELTGGVWFGSPPVPGTTLATGSTSFTNAGESALDQVGGYMSLTPAGGGEVSLSWSWSPGQALFAYGDMLGTSALVLTYTVTGGSTFRPTVTYVITDAGSGGEANEFAAETTRGTMTAGQYGVTSSLGAATGVGPFLLPPNLTAGGPVSIYVVGPVASGALPGVVTLPSVTLPSPAPSTQAIFTLSLVRPLGNFPLPAARVDVDSASAWSADQGTRAAMATAFKVFRAQLEALETGASAVLGPGASDLIINRVASALPLRLDEILPYYYAFDAAAQSIDLVPGMSLRVDWAGYQYCDGPGGTGYGLNGFAATGTSHHEVVRRPDGTLAFDAFSAQFAPGIGLQPPAGCPLVAGGPLDLQLSGNARRHLRLVWPTSFSGAGSVDNGGTSNQLSCVLLGAASFADLEAATAAVVSGQSACGTGSAGADPVVSISFTGRVTLVPEIWVWVVGSAQRVPLGTTVRHLAQRFADPIPLQMQAGNLSPTNLQLTLQRWAQSNTAPIAPNTPSFASVGIQLSQAAAAVGLLGDGFDMPLIKGDVLWINVPAAP